MSNDSLKDLKEIDPSIPVIPLFKAEFKRHTHFNLPPQEIIRLDSKYVTDKTGNIKLKQTIVAKPVEK